MLGVAAQPAVACVEVGVYRDAPASLGTLDKQVGRGVTVISTYVTVGRTIDPNLIKLAKQRRAKLMVTLMFDGGKDGSNQPKFTTARIASGRFDGPVRLLARQIKGSGLNVVLRPMPEMNTEWWAWSGTKNTNTADSYVAAWKRVRRVVKLNGGKRVKLLWAPYARSIPDTDDNSLERYFPGNDQVDLVGTSGYNFGTVGELEWLTPLELFQDPYAEIRALSTKPFWIAETGTSTKGGIKATWLRSLVALQKSLPGVRGVVLYDVREANGDFRISTTKPARAATRAVLATRCGIKKKG